MLTAEVLVFKDLPTSTPQGCYTLADPRTRIKYERIHCG